MEKKYIYLIVTIIIILLIMLNLVLFRGKEDDWIKTGASHGVYIKHGRPATVPAAVKEQQDAIVCANSLYKNALQSGMQFNSQCLGKCSDYSVDIVHVPRSDIDNIQENQCLDYNAGVTHKFIELDKNGEIVQVHD